MPVTGIISLCCYVNFIESRDNILFLTEQGRLFLSSIEKKLFLVNSIFESLKKDSNQTFFSNDGPQYDIYLKKYVIKKSNISLKYSGLRNLLLELCFFFESDENNNLFILDGELFNSTEKNISELVRKKSLDELKRALLRKEEYGKQAEDFVVSYERKRVSKKCKQGEKNI
jgi:hypothetical protein